MKNNKFSRIALLTAVAIAVALIFTFLTFPKFILLDQILSKNGIYLMAKSVRESLFGIEFKNVVIYEKNSKIAYFEKLDIRLNPFFLSLIGKDSEGFIDVKYYFLKNEYTIKCKELKSFEKFFIKEADLKLGNEIKGNLIIKKIKLRGFELDKLSIDFKGKIFDAHTEDRNFNFRGNGILEINKNNLLNSKLTGEMIDNNLKILISGTLKNLSFDLKPIN